MPPGYLNPILTFSPEDRQLLRDRMGDLMRTPNLNPAPGQQRRITPSAMPSDRGSAPTLPTAVSPTLPMPIQTAPGVPGAEGMRPPARLSLDQPMPDAGPTLRPMIPTSAAAPMLPAPEMIDSTRERLGQASAASMNRAGVDLPALPGDSRPKPYSPIEAARYDAGMQRAKRDAEGNLTGGFKRSKGDIAMNILYGLAQGAQAGGGLGAIGGAIAGGIGTAINPAAGAQYRFDTEVAPRMRAEQRAAAEARQQMQDEEKARLANAKTQTDIDKIREDFSMRRAEFEAKQREAERKEKADASKLTSFNPEYDLRDPSGKLIYKGQPRATTQRPEYPFSSAGNSIYNRMTGEITFQGGDGKEPTAMKVPDSSRKLLGEIEAARASGDKAAFNQLVGKLGGQFGDIFETGTGEGGWAYFKPKMSAPAAHRGSQGTGAVAKSSAAPAQKIFPASRLDEFAASKGMTLDQARDHIQRVRGYRIQ